MSRCLSHVSWAARGALLFSWLSQLPASLYLSILPPRDNWHHHRHTSLPVLPLGEATEKTQPRARSPVEGPVSVS